MKPTSHKTIKQRRAAILQQLFPEGIRETEIWNGLVGCLKPGDHERVSVERLEVVAVQRLKLKQRIGKAFPTVTGLFAIIRFDDVKLHHRITQTTWRFSKSHRLYARDAIVLHGLTTREILLDWAAQAVITMLLRRIKVRIRISPQPVSVEE